jgi:hypothetical protein
MLYPEQCSFSIRERVKCVRVHEGNGVEQICSQLVLFLGHWPLWSGCQVSSSVCEQHDSPALDGELGPAVLAAPHVQLLRLSDATLASFVELPALDMPAGAAATTPGEHMPRPAPRPLIG